jgi:hypothetical protein
VFKVIVSKYLEYAFPWYILLFFKAPSFMLPLQTEPSSEANFTYLKGTMNCLCLKVSRVVSCLNAARSYRYWGFNNVPLNHATNFTGRVIKDSYSPPMTAWTFKGIFKFGSP